MMPRIRIMLNIATRLLPVAALSLALLHAHDARAADLATWDTASISGSPSTLAATVASNMESSTLTRGSGLTASSLASAFSSTAWNGPTDLAGSITSNDYYQITVQAASGYVLNLSALAFNFRRSSTGPNAMQWRYSLDGANFTTIGTAISYTLDSGDGHAQGPVVLSGISDLQNVAANTVVTLRLYGWGASASAGSGAIGKLAGNDLVVSGTTASAGPAAPASFAAAVASHQQINLSWTKNGAGNNVIVAWNTASSFGDPVDAATYTAGGAIPGGGTVLYVGSDTSANHTSLDANVTYYYKAWSVDGSTEYSAGVTANATTDDLPAPTVNAASATNATGFTAAWGTVPGADGYRLDVATNSVMIGDTVLLNETFVNFTTPENTEITDDLNTYTLVSGWTGEKVYAANEDGLAKLGTTSARGILVTPALDLSAGSGITLRFNAKSWSGDSTAIQVMHAPDGVNFVQVVATISLTESMVSYSRSIEGGTALSKIRFYPVNNSNDRYYLDNIQVEQESTYLDGYANLPVGDVAAYAVTGLVSSTEYFYRVRATNDNSTSANSAVQSVTTLVMPAPSSVWTSTTGALEFVANWSAVTEATGYYLDVSTNNAFTVYQPGYSNRVVNGINTTTVTGLLASLTYHYRVRAYDAGSTSAYSATQSVTTTIKPEPSNHATGFGAATVTHRTIILDWNDASGGIIPDGYLVRGSTNGYDAIPTPTDTVNVPNSTNWPTGYANKIVQGVQADELRGLAAQRTYYFKLFPYANQFSLINFKTDGSVPQFSVTTGVAPLEDFEDVTAGSYATNTLALKSGAWLIEDGLLGIDESDKRQDQRAARLRQRGALTMQFDVTAVETFSLEYANFGTDTGGKFVVEISTDSGGNWQPVNSEVSCSDALQTASTTIHQLGAMRFRIRMTGGNRINIDNIRLTPYEHPRTVFRFR
jgi:hypothetical protein